MPRAIGSQTDTARALRVIKGYLEEGRSYQEIGDEEGVTRERIRQILEDYGFDYMTVREQRAAVKRAQLEEEKDRHRERVLTFFREGGGIDHVIAKTGLRKALIKVILDELPRDERRILSFRGKGEKHHAVDSLEVLIDRLQQAARRYGEPLKGSDFDKMAREKGWVGVQTTILRFNTWREACAAAGIKAHRARRMNYGRISNEDIIAALEMVTEQLGYLPSTNEYDRIARENKLPSLATARHRLGTWIEISELLQQRRAGSTPRA